MEITIRKTQGLYDEMELSLHRGELADVILSMPYADILNGHYGIVRHPMEEVPDELRGAPCSYDPLLGRAGPGKPQDRSGWLPHGKGLEPYKPAPPDHLRGLGLLDATDSPSRRVIVIGNRNLGNNWGFVAYHRDWKGGTFALKREPVESRPYPCLTWRESRGLSIEELRFPESGVVARAGGDHGALDQDIRWATFGNHVLAEGCVRSVQEMAGEFYDIRHLLSLTHHRDAVRMQEIWDGYPNGFAEKLIGAIQSGIPRSRYLHNCVAVSQDRIGIIQKYGTPEEIAEAARQRGFRDAVILDNGGSVFTYAWFVRGPGTDHGPASGGCIFASADWRPPSISTLCFVLHGPVWLDEPRGSVAFHIA